MNINIRPLYRPVGLILSKRACARIILHRNTAQHNVSTHVRQLIDNNIFDQNAIDNKLGAQYYDFKNAIYWLKLQNPEIKIREVKHFTGELTPIDSNAGLADTPDYLDDQTICWLEPNRETSLFSAAYTNLTDLLNDITNPVKTILPDEFPYWSYIRTIYGAYLE